MTDAPAAIVDSHCHLDFPDFDGEHAALIARARAAGVSPGMVDDGDARLICSRLDGLPLAIELVAASVAALGTSSIVRLLDQRLDVLQSHRPRTTDRHGTMRATIDWSSRREQSTVQQLWSAWFGVPSIYMITRI